MRKQKLLAVAGCITLSLMAGMLTGCGSAKNTATSSENQKDQQIESTQQAESTKKKKSEASKKIQQTETQSRESGTETDGAENVVESTKQQESESEADEITAEEGKKFVIDGVIYKGDVVVGFEQKYDENNQPLYTDIEISTKAYKIKKEAFKNVKDIKSVKLPISISVIGKSAFEGCTGLVSITFPEEFVWIKEKAFYGCTALKMVEMTAESEGTEYFPVGEEIFGKCTALESLNLSSWDTVPERTFYGCTGLKKVILDQIRLQSEAFADCTSLEDIIFDIEYVTDEGLDYSYMESIPMGIDVFKNTKLVNDAKQNNEPAIVTIGDMKALLWIGAGDGDVVIDGKQADIIMSCAFDESIQDIKNITIDGVDFVHLEHEESQEIERFQKYKLEQVTITNAKEVKIWKLLPTEIKKLLIKDVETICGATNMYTNLYIGRMGTMEIIHVDEVQNGSLKNARVDNLIVDYVKAWDEDLKEVGTAKYTNMEILTTEYYEDTPVIREVTEKLEISNIQRVNGFRKLKAPKVKIADVTCIANEAFCKADIGKVTIENVEELESAIFKGATLDKVTISNVTKMGENLFKNAQVGEKHISNTIE